MAGGLLNLVATGQQNILLNGKFVPNIHNIPLPPFKKPSTVVQNWTGVQSCSKTPDEMYNYLFPK